MHRALILLIVCCGWWEAIPAARAAEASTAADKIDFRRDVRPILAEHCFKCHGPEQQESDFRLDRRDEALRGGENGVAIVPGKAGESLLLDRVAGTDADLRMPPKGERLPAAAVDTLRRWIDEGAAWAEDPAAAAGADTASGHWALRALARPDVPQIEGATHPIDAFVRAALGEHGLKASAEADRRTLLRRLSIDLIGLTPTPEEMAEFLADARPDAYERQVDRLLASPRYGERWARHWIDVVHFAETHGNDQDRPRPNAWPYRDYLVRAFNEDKSYDRFVAEQVAGDVIFPDDPQATVALGFLAAGPWDESSQMCIVDDTLDKRLAQLLDRDDMITNLMSTFTSTTVHCARCHNHKFDPISQGDYYALQAALAGIDRAERPFDSDPRIHHERQSLLAHKHEIATCRDERLSSDPGWQAEIAAAELDYADGRDLWQVLPPVEVVTTSGSQSTPQSDGSLLFTGNRPDTDTYTLTLDTALKTITALKLEVLSDGSLPRQGPGRQDNGNLHLSEFKLFLVGADGQTTPLPIATAFADFEQQNWGIAKALDGDPKTAWGIYPEVSHSHWAVFVLAEPLVNDGHARLIAVLDQLHGEGHLIGRPRLSVTNSPKPATASPVPARVPALLAIAPAERSAAEAAELARLLLTWRVERQLAALPAAQLVYAAAHEFAAAGNFRPSAEPRPVHVLRRGDINQPLAVAEPGALSSIAGLPGRFALDGQANEGERRAALAHWLIDPANVLTWRSIVNRIWHYHFGRGIVDTPNDLGKMGGQPSHPQLLDWLAVEFRDSGGSLKQLHRSIVMSATYRQSSQIDDARAQIDAQNRLLWRMNRTRLDAETIRDSILEISGKLDLTMGGPSVKQFVQSPGVHVTPKVDYLSYDIDAPGNHRRSIYRFLFRTLPDPFLESLDCPDGSQLTPTRSESVGALQALAMLNDRFVVRQSEHTAARLASESSDLPGQIRRLFQLVLLREPTEAERTRWEEYAARHGLANACRMLLNSNEFVFVH
ncbi:MAG TPA: PSD1 and planctomycete cytochrome C domain-containing protein [Pirellulales bacterium]|nr:PSD1 and planctomycete cytochrome C domain-containing protein [Pirellulales bacterium]